MAAFVAIPVAAAIAPSMVYEFAVVRRDVSAAPSPQSVTPPASAVEGRVHTASPSTGTSPRLPTLTQVAWTLWAGVAVVLLARLGIALARLLAHPTLGLPWLEGC